MKFADIPTKELLTIDQLETRASTHTLCYNSRTKMVLKDDPDLGSMASGYTSIEAIHTVSTLVGMLKNSELTPSWIAKNRERFTSILSKYRDEFYLLAPHLNDILKTMLNIIRDESFLENVKHDVFKYIFIVMSFMTLKKVASYLPIETREFLNSFLSIVSKTSNDVKFEGTITNSILELCKSYLLLNNAHWAAAVFLISNLLNRSDIAEDLKLYGQMVLDEATKMNVQKTSKL